MHFVLPTSGLVLPCAVPNFTGIAVVIAQPAYSVYGVCGSRNTRRFGRRATDVTNGNAGPKLHWLVWEKSGFPALARKLYFLVENKGHDGGIWAKGKLFLAYCLYIRSIFKKLQRKYCFTPIDSSAVVGPALPIAICREKSTAMHRFIEISGPA